MPSLLSVITKKYLQFKSLAITCSIQFSRNKCVSNYESCSPGNVLLSRLPAEQVPSALEGLTAVFGMGTGVSPPPSSPDSGSLLKSDEN
jgi:hypothetical protein